MSNNMLKNWQETACTEMNTADILLFGRIYEKRVQTRRTGLVLQWTFHLKFLFISY